MQRPFDFDPNDFFSQFEQLDQSLPLLNPFAAEQAFTCLSHLAQVAGLNHTVNDVTHFFAQAQSFMDFCYLMQLPVATIRPVFKDHDLYFIEIKLNLNAKKLLQRILDAPYKTLNEFADSLKVYPEEIADYLNQKQLPPYWKIRFLSQPVGKLLLRLRPEFRGARPVSIARIADENGTTDHELNAEFMRIFTMNFDGLMHLIQKMPPEKFYSLILQYQLPLNELDNKQSFILLTKMTLACHPQHLLFNTHQISTSDPLLLQNPHVVLPPNQRRN